MANHSRAFMRKFLKKMKLPDIRFNTDEEKWAWLSALIDGEGCLGLYRQYKYKINWQSDGKSFIDYSRERNGYHYRAKLVIANTSPELIMFLDNLLHGSIVIYENKYRFCFQWIIGHHRLKPLLPKLLPYLIVKRKQAELIMKAFELEEKNANQIAIECIANQVKEATDNLRKKTHG